jgi:hypothetical protein
MGFLNEIQRLRVSHLLHSSTTLWTWKNQRSICSHGPWGSTILDSSLATKTQENQVVRPLTPYFLLLIQWSWGTVDFPMKSHPSIRYSFLKLPSQVFKRIVPPHTGLLRLYAIIFTFRVLEGLFKEGISMERFTQGTT